MPYEEYFKAASESLIVVDPDGRILEANLKTEQLFGYRQDELVGQPVDLLLPEQLRESHREHVDGYFATPRTRVMGRGLNLLGRRKDGSEFPVEVSLTYAQGTLRGDLVVATAIDITQCLALEREARKAETITSLGTIAVGIAHELNQPLGAILVRISSMREFSIARRLAIFAPRWRTWNGNYSRYSIDLRDRTLDCTDDVA